MAAAGVSLLPPPFFSRGVTTMAMAGAITTTGVASAPRRPVPANSRDERPVRVAGREDTALLDWMGATVERVAFDATALDGRRWTLRGAGVERRGRSLREAARLVRAEVERRDAGGP